MKKAKLDILEDMPGIEIEVSGDPIEPDYEIEPRVESGKKWAVNKLILISVPLALLVIITVGILASYVIRNFSAISHSPEIVSKTEQPRTVSPEATRTLPEAYGKKQDIAAQPVALPEETTVMHLKDFMIDLTDSNGNNHVLMCDIVFDIGGEQNHDQSENITVIRNIIYKTAKSRSAVALRSVEERKKLKKELAFELGKILGEGSVKNVYFMNYFIM